MGFELMNRNRKAIPMIICDTCKKPILKANLGVITWNKENNKDEKTLFKVIHKGKCDINKNDLSMELRTYFAHLDANCIRETKEDDREDAELSEEF